MKVKFDALQESFEFSAFKLDQYVKNFMQQYQEKAKEVTFNAAFQDVTLFDKKLEITKLLINNMDSNTVVKQLFTYAKALKVMFVQLEYYIKYMTAAPTKKNQGLQNFSKAILLHIDVMEIFWRQIDLERLTVEEQNQLEQLYSLINESYTKIQTALRVVPSKKIEINVPYLENKLFINACRRADLIFKKPINTHAVDIQALDDLDTQLLKHAHLLDNKNNFLKGNNDDDYSYHLIMHHMYSIKLHSYIVRNKFFNEGQLPSSKDNHNFNTSVLLILSAYESMDITINNSSYQRIAIENNLMDLLEIILEKVIFSISAEQHDTVILLKKLLDKYLETQRDKAQKQQSVLKSTIAHSQDGEGIAQYELSFEIIRERLLKFEMVASLLSSSFEAYDRLSISHLECTATHPALQSFNSEIPVPGPSCSKQPPLLDSENSIQITPMPPTHCSKVSLCESTVTSEVSLGKRKSKAPHSNSLEQSERLEKEDSVELTDRPPTDCSEVTVCELTVTSEPSLNETDPPRSSGQSEHSENEASVELIDMPPTSYRETSDCKPIVTDEVSLRKNKKAKLDLATNNETPTQGLYSRLRGLYQLNTKKLNDVLFTEVITRQKMILYIALSPELLEQIDSPSLRKKLIEFVTLPFQAHARKNQTGLIVLSEEERKIYKGFYGKIKFFGRNGDGDQRPLALVVKEDKAQNTTYLYLNGLGNHKKTLFKGQDHLTLFQSTESKQETPDERGKAKRHKL